MQDNLKVMYDSPRPLVFAHRGAMAYAPMNTLAAFQLALEQGADGIELDVWLSQDDVPVVVHDFEVDGTTDGEGRVGSMTLAELKDLDAGSWFDARYAGQRIPKLDEVFDAVGQRLYVNVEIKSIEMNNARIVHHVVEAIRKHGMTDRVIVSSFNPFVIRQMRRAATDIPLGLLQDHDLPFFYPLVMIGTKYVAEHPNHKQVNERYMAKAKRAGKLVNVWTVNDTAEAMRLRDLGVNGIITDAPDTILAALEVD